MPPIVETVYDEEFEDEFYQTPEGHNEYWFPCPIYSVSASGTYKSRIDLDSHADTTVLGKHCMGAYDTNRTAELSPFLPELGTAEKIWIFTGAIAYNHPDGGGTIIILLKQALYIPALRHNLLCDNQNQ